MSHRHPRQASGFTLVEMLTVIAIITLLIGILVPSLTAARNQATRAAVKAQINSIVTGSELFRNEENEYPKSNPYTFGPIGDAAAQTTAINQWEVNGLSGAHLIVDAMIGRDTLGYDPRPGTGAGGSVDSRWFTGVGPDNQPRFRRNPYVRPEGISLATADKPVQDAFGTYPNQNVMFPQLDAADVRVPVFYDKFGFPVLYYRANSRATQRTPIIQSSAGAAIDANVSDGVYDGRDNELFTSPVGRPPGAQHPIRDANQIFDYPGGQSFLTNKFAEYMRSFRATSFVPNSGTPPQIDFPRPVNGESFILLSAGKDGIFGNLDDVANFEVLSAER